MSTDTMLRVKEQAQSMCADSTREEVLAALDGVAFLKEALAAIADTVETGAIAWVERHGELVAGSKRYYVGPNKTTKCVSVRDTLESALNATGGDIGQVANLLSASAFKPGACRETLPVNDYTRLFKTVETPDLKTGVVRDRLQKVDERFTGGRHVPTVGAAGHPEGPDPAS